MKQHFMLGERETRFLVHIVISSTMDAEVMYRLLEVNPRKLGYLVEVSSRGEVWRQWFYEDKRPRRRMIVKQENGIDVAN